MQKEPEITNPQLQKTQRKIQELSEQLKKKLTNKPPKK